jgi:hypothetical protein
LYSVEGESIRWTFSQVEDHHLFATLDQLEATIAIAISGSWQEGLTFQALQRDRVWINNPDGPFLVHRNGDGHQRCIVTSIQFFHLDRITRSQLPDEAEIVANIVKNSPKHEIVVYPKHVLASRSWQPTGEREETFTATEAFAAAGGSTATDVYARNVKDDLAEMVIGEAVEADAEIVQAAEEAGFSAEDLKRHPDLAEILIEEVRLKKERSMAAPHNVTRSSNPPISKPQQQQANKSTSVDDQPEIPSDLDLGDEPLAADLVEADTDVAADNTATTDAITVPTDNSIVEEAKALLGGLNPILARNPNLKIYVGEGGKSLRVTRQVVTVRRIH